MDSNDFYGGSEAAFSLQEAETWVETLAETPSLPFANVTVSKPQTTSGAKLSSSRAYTLTLSPQITYSKSRMLNQLVSSQVYRQLEFQAVGNWWIYEVAIAEAEGLASGVLKRIPNGREDIFSDRGIDVRAKRGLMKFLKFVIDYENQPLVWKKYAETPLVDFLAFQFQLPEAMQCVITALTLSLSPPSETSVGYALPRIARHLTSIGVFGPGFGAVVPKWGGNAEIAQVACRAGAVGGAVYILGTGVAEASSLGTSRMALSLTNGETVRTKYYVYSQDAQHDGGEDIASLRLKTSLSKIISIVSSNLSDLFRTTVEGAPVGAVSVVAFPANSLTVDAKSSPYPVYLMVHSSDTGECPHGQCIIYGSTSSKGNPKGRLDAAIAALLRSLPSSVEDYVEQSSSRAEILFELYYEQSRSSDSNLTSQNACGVPSSSLDLAFSDATLDNVEDAWRQVNSLGHVEGAAPIEASYMAFAAREQLDDDEDD